MKYFSLDTVISSFEDNRTKTTDGFWGIMAILKSIDSQIAPCTQYDINCQRVANILERWFSVRQEYKNYNTSAIWYVVFSAMWIEQLSMFLKYNPAPNIYSIIGWMYQSHEFEETPTNAELLALFCKDTSIEFDKLPDLFDMSTRVLNFSDSRFSHREKLNALTNRFGVIGSNNSVKCNGSYIVAEAGAFQRAPFTQTLYASTENYKCLMITSAAPDVYYPENFVIPSNKSVSTSPRQVIYFGAPGTGKSFEVNRIVNELAPKRNIRTTFHPDTDYSSFVGCYKPTMKCGQIEYAFTAQAFIRAYISAWSDLSSPFFLIIEEINRGNCAQIFGDIFQLLDRNLSGESTYGIVPDSDLKTYIAEKLNSAPNIPEEIRSGEQMRLPSNLFIYATMNTSDQSLFPIDSAFKRRWDMRYTAIKPGEKDHVLVVGELRYNWTSFIREVNKKIYDLTKSEDKQLGYWFISPDVNHEIDWKLFVSKAMFYIWNDVIKDYATMEKEDSPFGKKFSFTTFYNEHGEPIIDQTIAFLDKLGVEKLPVISEYSNLSDNSEVVSEPDVEYFDDEISSEEFNQDGSGRDNTKYQINGTGKIGKKYLAFELIKRYIQDHPKESAFEVVKAWKSLGDLVSHFVELQEEFDQRTDKEPRVKVLECNGENIYVSTNGWGGKAKMQELISAVDAKDWGLTVTEYKA